MMSEARVTVLPDAATQSKQTIAADPKISAWVSANAGSGKTYVLATRVIRLLLDRVDPSKLLCLTFTKTAAAEMKSRVFERLGAWVVMDDAALADQLAQIDGQRPGPAKLQFARTLFAAALEAPGGLKIQTIHAFCEALLHRFPLEANIAGHFDLLDDYGAQGLMAEARRHVLSGSDRPAPLTKAVDEVLTQEGEAAFGDLIAAIIAKRRLLWDFLQDKPENAALSRLYADAFGLEAGVDRATIIARAWPLDWFDQTNLAR
ncbi:MAG: UvrD-helicase domain-containing protein, partial [Pseudomonadota bacterium]